MIILLLLLTALVLFTLYFKFMQFAWNNAAVPLLGVKTITLVQVILLYFLFRAFFGCPPRYGGELGDDKNSADRLTVN